MSLFSECLEALGEHTKVLSHTETEHIFSIFEDRFPITKWGRIDWNKISEKIKLNSNNEIIPYLHNRFTHEELRKDTYILWNDASLSAVESQLEQIVKVIDDVTAVSFDTWVFSPTIGYAIEFYHEGEIFIGII